MIVTTYAVFCDGTDAYGINCSALVGGSALTSPEARLAAKTDGWGRNWIHQSMRDLCPDCQTKVDALCGRINA
jgi:hypothetical protein